MEDFSVSKDALEQIRHMFLESQCLEPVAKIYEVADVSRDFGDLAVELLAGIQPVSEIKDVAFGRLQRVQGTLRSILVVGVCERGDFQSYDLRNINGITFSLGKDSEEFLLGYQLVFEKGAFWFRGPGGTTHTLRSIAALRK